MRRYTESAMARAMRVQEVLVRAIGGQISWVAAGEILALCPRQVLRLRRLGRTGIRRRWCGRLQQVGD